MKEINNSFRMNIMEEIFKFRSYRPIEVLSNDTQIYTIDQYILL